MLEFGEEYIVDCPPTKKYTNRTRQNMKAMDASARQGEYYNTLLKRLQTQDATLDGLQKH